MKKYLLLFSLLLIPVISSNIALAAPDCHGNEMVGGICIPTSSDLPDPTSSDLPDPGISSPIGFIIFNLMQWMLALFWVVAIIGFAISGIQYLTSAGDEARIESAKRHMKWSIVGVIVALSGVVIIFAVDAMLNANAGF